MNPACKNLQIITNSIASHIVNTSKVPKDRDNTIQVKKELKVFNGYSLTETAYYQSFNCNKVSLAI